MDDQPSLRAPIETISGTVLVVDDNEQNRLLAEAQLRAAGYESMLAEDGLHALALAARHAFDLVLLDVMMPGIDGFETCRRLRRVPAYGAVPVLFLTASHEAGLHDQALASGGDDFLRKPIDRTELLLRVRSLIRITRLQRQRDRLTDLLVHDLKNPLASIIANAEFSLESAEDSDVKSALGDVVSAAQGMNRMVLNLLDIGAADEGVLTPKLSDVDVGAVLHEVARSCRARIAMRRQQLVLDVEPKAHIVRADHELLTRVLQNLVDNALRSAPASGVIGVVVQATPTTLQIRVSDDGSGIPLESRDSIFQRIGQADGGPIQRGSHGLGLVFCRVAAEAHGGRVWVEDNAPRGSVFILELPTVR